MVQDSCPGAKISLDGTGGFSPGARPSIVNWLWVHLEFLNIPLHTEFLLKNFLKKLISRKSPGDQKLISFSRLSCMLRSQLMPKFAKCRSFLRTEKKVIQRLKSSLIPLMFLNSVSRPGW